MFKTSRFSMWIHPFSSGREFLDFYDRMLPACQAAWRPKKRFYKGLKGILKGESPSFLVPLFTIFRIWARRGFWRAFPGRVWRGERDTSRSTPLFHILRRGRRGKPPLEWRLWKRHSASNLWGSVSYVLFGCFYPFPWTFCSHEELNPQGHRM